MGQTNWSDIQGGKLIYLYFIVTTGFAFLRRITMPPVKESAWSANWAAFSLVGANVFILTVFNCIYILYIYSMEYSDRWNKYMDYYANRRNYISPIC